MSSYISSAKPTILANYSRSMAACDGDLAQISSSLGATLAQFTSTCREYSLPVGQLAAELEQHANKASHVDLWVGLVAVEFWVADAQNNMVTRYQQGMFALSDTYKGSTKALSGLPVLLYLFGSQTLGVLPDIAENRGAFREGLREFGRFLNDLEGSVKAGNVGKMDDIYRTLVIEGMPNGSTIDKVLSSKWFGSALVGVDAVFGTIEDIKDGTYGDDLAKTIGVNSIDAGVNWLVALNPYGAAALAINAGVQIGGHLEVGLDRAVADYTAFDDRSRDILLQTAQIKEDAYEQIDLGNVTKQLSEGIYEGYSDYFSTVNQANDEFTRAAKSMWNDHSFSNIVTVMKDLGSSDDVQALAVQQMGMALGPLAPLIMTSSGRRNLVETGEAVVNVVDGLVDLKVAQVTTFSNRAIATSTKIVDSLPVSEKFKSQVKAWSTKSMELNTNVAEKLTGFIGFDF